MQISLFLDMGELEDIMERSLMLSTRPTRFIAPRAAILSMDFLVVLSKLAIRGVPGTAMQDIMVSFQRYFFLAVIWASA